MHRALPAKFTVLTDSPKVPPKGTEESWVPRLIPKGQRAEHRKSKSQAGKGKESMVGVLPPA